MYVLIGIWVLSVIGAFCLGYQAKRFRQEIDTLKEAVKTKVDKPEEPKSTLIDPTDPIQEARWEQKKMMEKLNE